ncbi:hypothetical protein B566_EDAN005102 [Ephemera danica]|nr:hypothetical protein B566_EDAN005102 [Ephemera danica]
MVWLHRLQNGKVVIRPVACRPAPSPGATRLQLGTRLGERYGSTPSLVQRPGSRLALYGNARVTWQRGCAESSSRGSLPPSPGSESGDGELEAALRERDVEIGQLRDTLERNEAAIFTVYEEKERAWEREVRKLRALYETRLRASQQKALRVEQTLASHTYQLQQETRRLKTELNTAQTENERSAALVAELRQELAVLRARLDDTEWVKIVKPGEQASRSHELISLRAELREAQASLAASDQRAEQRLTAERAAFQEERLTWLREKEQVLHYQRRLQLNYVHMYRRTRTLEAQLDGGDLKKERTSSGGDVEERAVLCKPAARRGLVPTLENHTIEL